MDPHPGIVISRIPASGGGGLIFALGTALVCLLAAPALSPLVGACAAAGLALSPVLIRLTERQAATLAAVVPGTAIVASLAFALGTPALRGLVAACVIGGVALAFALVRAQHAPLSIRHLTSR
jgi:hypothetical protein